MVTSWKVTAVIVVAPLAVTEPKVSDSVFKYPSNAWSPHPDALFQLVTFVCVMFLI